MHVFNRCFDNIILKILLFCLYLNNVFIKQNCQVSAAYTTERQRVLNEYIDTYSIQCPITSKPNNELVTIDSIYWINENLSYNKIDQDVNIPNNLIEKGKLTIKISPGLNYVSCGYLYNNIFIRVKMWNIAFVEIATINLNVVSNPALIYLNKINSTLSSVSVSPTENVREWNKPYDLLRFRCETNYDVPCDTKYVWMYFYNPVTCVYEIWHKNDGNDTKENIYQIFINERYQSVTSKSASLSEFLRYLLLNQITSIQFQCASYYQDQYLIATSQNLSLIHGTYFPVTLTPLPTLSTSSPSPMRGNDNNGVLIGAIVGSILGFLAFLALILCLIYCCCCHKRRASKNQNVKITNNQNLASRSTASIYPSSESHEIGRQSYQNMTMHSQHNSVPIGYLPSTPSHNIDKVTQFNNQIDMSNHLNTSNAISCTSSSNHNMTNIRTIAPEVYLKMITVTKDVNEDINSVHNEQYKYDACSSVQQQRNDYPREIVYGESYIPDDGFYSERKEYIIQNIHQQHQQQQHQQQHQQQQQNEISVHYV